MLAAGWSIRQVPRTLIGFSPIADQARFSEPFTVQRVEEAMAHKERVINRSGAATVLLFIAMVAAAVHSQTTQPSTAPAYSPEALREGAEQTYVNFARAWREGTESDRERIAAKYWTDPIKALKPIRIYTHRANFVVVQREGSGTEEGKYIYLRISSYHPHNGADGFEFTPNPQDGTRYTLGAGVWDYRRTLPAP